MRCLKGRGPKKTEPNVASTLSRIRRWAKGLAGLQTSAKTEITVETDRVLILRRERLTRGWCHECERHVNLVSLEDAADIANMSERNLAIGPDEIALHYVDGQGERPLLCLESLLKLL
jgi:hypothetical protein